MLSMLLLSIAHVTGYCDEQPPHTSTGSPLGESLAPQYADISKWPCCKAMPYWLLQDPANLGSEAEGIHPTAVVSFKDRDGLRRDTWYFLGYQVAAVGILYALPESVTGWTDEQKENYSMSIWWDNVRNPTWDTDDFAINYILHPYWGGAYYVRARERGYSGKEAFWYSAMLSAMYEFGAEALFEQPSIQDLILTPVLGSYVGAYFMNVRADIRERTYARGHRSTGDKWLWVLTDPLGALNRQVDKLFRRETDLMVSPFISTRRLVDDPYGRPVMQHREKVFGLNISLAW